MAVKGLLVLFVGEAENVFDLCDLFCGDVKFLNISISVSVDEEVSRLGIEFSLGTAEERAWNLSLAGVTGGLA